MRSQATKMDDGKAYRRRGPWAAPHALALLAAFAETTCSQSTHQRRASEKTESSAVRLATASLPLPAPQPLIFRPVAPEDAEGINAGIPFATGRIAPVRPFAFPGGAADEERAVTCLAAAAWYEAGDDTPGEQAVIQVILNRVRHPAFPKTVCGVVFEGAERATGCQFTFACDGSLVRQPSEAAWHRARLRARQALAGSVMKSVGTATHYHADYVVPYWSYSLDKIARVGAHLFYRWKGFWGETAAFVAAPTGDEQLDPRIEHLDKPALELALGSALDQPAEENASEPAAPDTSVTLPELGSGTVKLADDVKAQFVVQLDPTAYAGGYALDALRLCKLHRSCMVAGWLKPDFVARQLPLNPMNIASAAFIYRKDETGTEDIRWDCRQVKRESRAQCLPNTMTVASSVKNAAAVPAPVKTDR